MIMEPFRADHMMERQRRERRNRLIAGGVTAFVLLFGVLFSGGLWHWAFHDLPDAQHFLIRRVVDLPTRRFGMVDVRAVRARRARVPSRPFRVAASPV